MIELYLSLDLQCSVFFLLVKLLILFSPVHLLFIVSDENICDLVFYRLFLFPVLVVYTHCTQYNVKLSVYE